MQKFTIVVNAIWDEEAAVWVAVSDDLPGLVAEAPDQEQLMNKLLKMIPDLLEDDAEGFDQLPEIPVVLMSQRLAKVRLRG